MRLDKRITALGLTRAQAKRLIARGEVRVNGEVERDAGRIVTDADEVRAQGTAAAAAGHTHLMLFKPAGVLTATLRWPGNHRAGSDPRAAARSGPGGAAG